MPIVATATLLKWAERIPGIRRWAAAVFYRTANREAAVELVAVELDYNAQAISSNLSTIEFGAELQLSAWNSYRREVIVATRRYPGVRQAIVDAYSDLHRAAAGKANPPSPKQLEAAAERLRAIN